MEKPWHQLNIDISNALRKDLDLKKLYKESEFKDSPVGIWFIQNHELENFFTHEWLEYMNGIKLPVGSCMIFYRKPHYHYPEVHVDIIRATSKPAIYALNWILDPDDDSEMIWYDPVLGEQEILMTPADTPYMSWPAADFENINSVRHTIKNIPTLVSTGIPHNVIVNEKERWAISIRFPRAQGPQNWEQAVEFFKPFIID